MKRSLFPTLLILGLILSLAGPIRSVQATNLLPLLDYDQDGLSNTMEFAGWYNLTGGPYLTNPSMADTDQDGLTDSEEKLFDTNPMDLMSPGISVKYQTAYKTFEYYSATDPAYLSMVRGGNHYLLTEALVARRGTTFKITAVNTPTAALTISGDGLTALSAVRDPSRGGWNVTVPTDGTVGTYTATITENGLSKSMKIYIIFELPTDLTQAQIDTFVYDDDPANKRDEVAVWWRAIDWKYFNNDSETATPCNPGDPICSDWQYHTIAGYAQAFWTEQFTKQVLVDFTLPAIEGKTNPYSAAEAIGEKADASTRIDFASVKNSFSSATKVFYDPTGHPLAPYSANGGACETTAGVLTAMLRSVGIASRPFAMDYNKTLGHGEQGNFNQFEHDHAVIMWIKGPSAAANMWYAERAFNGAEEKYQTTPSWVSGTTGLWRLSDIGNYDPANPQLQFKKFQDLYADMIQSANEGWDFQNGSLGGGMVNTLWTGIDVPGADFEVVNRDFQWNSKKPLEIIQSPYLDLYNCQLWKGDGWTPSEWYAPGDIRYQSSPTGRDALHTYYLPLGIPSGVGDLENWPYNPKPTACSASTSTEACNALKLAWQAQCTGLPGQGTPGALMSVQPQQVNPPVPVANSSIQIGNILGDTGVDLNGDNQFDQLDISFELTSTQSGEYQLGGWLRAGDKVIRSNSTPVSLTPGVQTLQISFDGQQIGDNGINGPYQVEAIWVAPADYAVSELALPEEMAAHQAFTYSTSSYQASAFNVLAAFIAGNYSYQGTDTNGNGLLDSIQISVPLNISVPGTYTVDGDLYDSQGSFVGHAQWTGSDTDALLEYTVANTVPPYSLAHLNLLDGSGKELGSFYAPVFQIDDLAGRIEQGTIVPESNSSEIQPESIVSTNTFTVTPLDTNSNSKYDSLAVSASVNVTVQGGSYWMEGLLVDGRGIPVAWSVGKPKTLNIGQNQTLQMDFATPMLFDHLPLTGSQQFTLVAVKIFSGSPGQAIPEAVVPVTGVNTLAYTRAQLEPSNAAKILVQDDMEAGIAKWSTNGSTQWSLSNNVWHSYTSAWMASGSSTKNGLLTLAAPLDLKNNSRPWIRFNTAYQLPGSANVTLEASKNGTTWTTLKTFTGSTTYWSPEQVDLAAYANTPGVRIRFNAQSTPGMVWYIDDIFITDVPATLSIFLPIMVR